MPDPLLFPLNEKKRISRRDALKGLGLGIAGVSGLLSNMATRQVLASPLPKIDAGSLLEANFIVFNDGGTIYAKNGKTGDIDYSGTDASTVIQAAIDSVPTGSAPLVGVKIFLKNGVYELNTKLNLKGQYKTFELEGEGEESTSLKYIGPSGVSIIDANPGSFLTLHTVILKNLRVSAMPSDWTSHVYGIDLTYCSSAIIRDVVVKADFQNPNQPGSIGILLGAPQNNIATLDGVMISWFERGIEIHTDHVTLTNPVVCECKYNYWIGYGLGVTLVNPHSFHPTDTSYIIYGGQHVTLINPVSESPGVKDFVISWSAGADYRVTIINFRKHKALEGYPPIVGISGGASEPGRVTFILGDYITKMANTTSVTGAVNSVNVSHGLAVAPTKVLITPLQSGQGYCWVSNKNVGGLGLQFTISFITQPGSSTWYFDWYAEV